MNFVRILYIFIIFLSACAHVCETHASLVYSNAKQFNDKAYDYRYVNIDTTEYYAKRVLSSSKDNDECAFAMENLAFVSYHQMCYAASLKNISEARRQTKNTLSLLCLDVMEMKVAQRTGDFLRFHAAMQYAQNRLWRIEQEETKLDPREKKRLAYARSEMHIIASTYYYYIHKEDDSRIELLMAKPDINRELDISQWLNYHYMLGSGGMIDDADEEKLLLQQVIQVSERVGNKYFHANALQALAEHTKNDSMALEAYRIFTEYGDILQSAASLRTLSELSFEKGEYDKSLHFILKALEYVQEQHQKDSCRELMWELQIEERLAMTYAALGEHEQMHKHRQAYLDCLSKMRQDEFSSQRQMQILLMRRSLYGKLLFLSLLTFIIAIAFMLLWRRKKRNGVAFLEEINNKIESVKEEVESLSILLSQEKISNIQSRAKVALVNDSLPIIERLVHPTATDSFIKDLLDEIKRRADILTNWISVKAGKLPMTISSFPVQSILETILHNRVSFERKGVKLIVPQTSSVVKADRVLTLFMLNTLCGNALKFTPSGGEVRISVEEDTDYVQLSVIDTGVGFHATENTKENKGHGFGLSNCQGIINKYRKMSQRFSVCAMGHHDNREGGCCVWFRLAKVLVVLFFIVQPSLMFSAERDSVTLYNYEAERALLDNDWNKYERYNELCLKHHFATTSDPDLPTFTSRVEQLERWGEILIYTSCFMLFVSTSFFVLLIRRTEKNTRKLLLAQESLDDIIDVRARLQYEYERVYCQNQIMDNCLSSIKHETMYYPARINQILDDKQAMCDRRELMELCQYFTELYRTLAEQCLRQLREPVFRRGIVDLSTIIEGIAPVNVIADKDLLTYLIQITDCHEPVVLQQDNEVKVTFPGSMTFSSGSDQLDAMTVREIIRIHDAFSGYPGLKLYNDNNMITFTLWKHSKS